MFAYKKNFNNNNHFECSIEMKNNCLNLIENFADSVGYPIPANLPYFKCNNTRITIPSIYSKKRVFSEYKKNCLKINCNFVHLRTFYN